MYSAIRNQVSGGTFVLYCLFLADFFLHSSARIRALEVLRPTLLLAVLITISLVFQKDKLRGRFDYPAAERLKALLIYLVLSLPLVSWPGSALNNADNFIKALVFFYFTVACVDSPERFRKVVLLFMALQTFRVLEPLYLNITEGYWGSRTYLGSDDGFAQRLAGAPADVINSNELGFVIATVIPFLHYYMFKSPRKLAKILYLVLLPALLYALILTMSRGAFLALLVVAFFVFRESRQKARMLALVMIGAVVAWSVMTPVQKDRYLSLVSSEAKQSHTVEGRLNGIIQEFELAMTRPIFGHGLGTTAEAKYHTFGKRQASHTLYAELIIEMGLIGAILFIRYLLALYQQLQATRALPDPGQAYLRRMPQVFQAVFWMYVVYSSNYWGLSQYYWYFFGGLILAYANVVQNQVTGKSQNAEEADNRAGKRLQLALPFREAKRT
ncbi:O-antigen ligase family protein [Hahella sp. SMD15-11]|uniref:O-antigen ligase family protein n=1 Tax=Thermohahella caldifontis TaxID=3142973 RepID=A0AB39UYM6_9GAMM